MGMTWSTSVSTRPSKEPVGASRFWIEVQGIEETFFTEVSGLNVTTEVFPYKEGGANSFVHQLPTRTTYSNIVLKRGYTANADFGKWYQNIIMGKKDLRKVSIKLYNIQSKLIRSWEVSYAYPVKYVAPETKAGNNSFAIETMELAHYGFLVA